jgi:uncharacterized protein YbgA (DUF1722 family)/uncharacterized protein YbbK (DUF523 family)
VEYVPVCPETEAGFGIPRESMHLEGEVESPRLVTSRTQRDMTDAMVGWANERVRQLESEDLCGFIFKANSPSSGMERVKLLDHNHVPRKIGVGLFAGIFMKHFPLLPVEEDGRLHDPVLRENFVARIFIFKRWREMMAANPGISELIDFHTRHKLLIMAHSLKHNSTLGKLVAGAKQSSRKEVFSSYETLLMEAVRLRATVRKNTNVLQHLMGYFKKELSADEKQELLEVIDQYHRGYVPLIVPVTLIRHYVRKYDQPYLKLQVYLNPHPTELALRNHV